MHVLVGYVIDGKSNGIDKYLLHVLDVMKQEDISFDFLTNHKTPELEAIFGAYHAGVIEMPSLKHPVGQYRFVNQLIQKEKYDRIQSKKNVLRSAGASWHFHHRIYPGCAYTR